MIRSAVIGNPISHSQSPLIFNSISKFYEIKSHYTRLAGNSFDEILNLAKLLNINSLNITSPYKNISYKSADFKDEYSEITKNSNFLIFENNRLNAYNTDYFAFQKIFSNLNFDKKDQILIFGAGDTAFLITKILNSYGYFNLNFVVRDKIKVKNDFFKNNQNLILFNELKSLKPFQLLINTVPKININISMIFDNPNIQIIDAIYKNPFLNKFSKNYISGYKWLIYQAIPAITKSYNIELDFEKIDSLMKNNISNKKKVVLIGFMASGKSTIANKLSQKLNMKYADSDDTIELKENTKIHNIFSNQGENYFRKIEDITIRELINSDNQIISIGGGALENTELANYIFENSYVIYLFCKLDILVNRIINSNIQRPKFDINNYVNLYNSRENVYFKYSDLIIDNSYNINNSINLLENEILNAF